jgi:pullulanase
MRQLVIDTVVHWLREYHVDGFRLDLAAILDDETLRAIKVAAVTEYPRAMVISEPWSMATYRPAPIAALGHTVWNDRFRNAMKGEDPLARRGFLFGAGQGGASRGETAVLL